MSRSATVLLRPVGVSYCVFVWLCRVRKWFATSSHPRHPHLLQVRCKMRIELDENELSGVIGCIQSRLVSLEQVYCRNVNEVTAPHFSALIVRYVRLMRKFDTRFELLTCSDSLNGILKREVYDA